MNRSTPDLQLEAALAYENLHVPALFRQWVPWVLDAAHVQPGQRVLDVACGTGVVAREAAKRVGAAGYVAGVDLNPGMIEAARRLAPDIEWRESAAESLPYANDSFDAVVCQFGLMFFADRLKALRQMLRVLVPGGHVAVAVWATLEDSPAYPIEVGLVDRLAGAEAAKALRAPFVLGSRDELTALLEYGGAAYIAVTKRTGKARFPSVRAMVEADLRGWLPVMGVHLDEDVIQRILHEADAALADYVTADGSAVFDAPGYIAVGTRP